jgi:predicted metal-dependent hydrolase
MRDRFIDAVHLFNAGRYFEAHESWEDEWRDANGPERCCLQGLVQAAVALHHRSTGNHAGAASVMARAIGNLKKCPEAMRRIDVARLRDDLANAFTDTGSIAERVQIAILRPE